MNERRIFPPLGNVHFAENAMTWVPIDVFKLSQLNFSRTRSKSRYFSKRHESGSILYDHNRLNPKSAEIASNMGTWTGDDHLIEFASIENELVTKP